MLSLHQLLEKADSLLYLSMWWSGPSLPPSPPLQASYSPAEVTKAEVLSFKLFIQVLQHFKMFLWQLGLGLSIFGLMELNINVFWELSLIPFNFIFCNCFMLPCLFSAQTIGVFPWFHLCFWICRFYLHLTICCHLFLFSFVRSVLLWTSSCNLFP